MMMKMMTKNVTHVLYNKVSVWCCWNLEVFSTLAHRALAFAASVIVEIPTLQLHNKYACHNQMYARWMPLLLLFIFHFLFFFYKYEHFIKSTSHCKNVFRYILRLFFCLRDDIRLKSEKDWCEQNAIILDLTKLERQTNMEFLHVRMCTRKNNSSNSN